MKLYLIRHAQSRNNALADTAQRNAWGQIGASGNADEQPAEFFPSADPPLTEVGEAQAQRIARHLRTHPDKTDVRDGVGEESGHRFDRLYSSAMLRALQTAQPIANALELKPEVWLQVHEEGGIWLSRRRGRPGDEGGLKRSQVVARFPEFDLPDELGEAGWWQGAAETREQLIRRAGQVATDIRARFVASASEHPQGAALRVAVVSHGTFLNFLVHHLLQGRAPENTYLSHHNTGITRIDFSGEQTMLRYQNRVDHLPHELVT